MVSIFLATQEISAATLGEVLNNIKRYLWLSRSLFLIVLMILWPMNRPIVSLKTGSSLVVAY